MVQVFPVSPKVHTTRQKALGVFSVDQTQVVSTTIALLLPPIPPTPFYEPCKDAK